MTYYKGLTLHVNDYGWTILFSHHMEKFGGKSSNVWKYMKKNEGPVRKLYLVFLSVSDTTANKKHLFIFLCELATEYTDLLKKMSPWWNKMAALTC